MTRLSWDLLEKLLPENVEHPDIAALRGPFRHEQRFLVEFFNAQSQRVTYSETTLRPLGDHDLGMVALALTLDKESRLDSTSKYYHEWERVNVSAMAPWGKSYPGTPLNACRNLMTKDEANERIAANDTLKNLTRYYNMPLRNTLVEIRNAASVMTSDETYHQFCTTLVAHNAEIELIVKIPEMSVSRSSEASPSIGSCGSSCSTGPVIR